MGPSRGPCFFLFLFCVFFFFFVFAAHRRQRHGGANREIEFNLLLIQRVTRVSGSNTQLNVFFIHKGTNVSSSHNPTKNGPFIRNRCLLPTHVFGILGVHVVCGS